MLGNDIVDLHVVEPPLHKRYLARVFTALERARICDNPTLLWLHWAAKEAAYKALKRVMPHVPFIPRRFEFDAEACVVSAGKQTLMADCCVTAEYVHVTCMDRRKNALCEVSKLIHRLNEAEAMQPSVAARRVIIEEFSQLLEVPTSRLSIISQSYTPAPCLYIDGLPSDHLLSLSHHGRFAAGCFVR